VVIDNFVWDVSKEYPHIAPGVYYISKKGKGAAQRIWIGK
jgi:hypothetical protein